MPFGRGGQTAIMKTRSAGIGEYRRQVINPDFSEQWFVVYAPTCLHEEGGANL